MRRCIALLTPKAFASGSPSHNVVAASLCRGVPKVAQIPECTATQRRGYNSFITRRDGVTGRPLLTSHFLSPSAPQSWDYGVGRGRGVGRGLGVALGVAVALGVGVTLGVGVPVPLGVGVTVGVAVGVVVGVTVGVALAVGVGVGVVTPHGVALDTGVGETVGVGGGVPTAVAILTRPQPKTLFGGPAAPHSVEEIKTAELFSASRLGCI